MGWFNRKQETKASEAGPVATYMSAGRPAWTPREYDKLADEAYVRNAVAFRCVKLIATSASVVPYLLKGPDGKEFDKHPMLDLLRSPAPMVSTAQFMEAVFAYLLLSGNSYVEAVGPERGVPKELWPLRPDRMKIIPSRYGTPSAYQYAVGGQKKEWPSDPVTRKSPILHVKEFHPTHDIYGLSRVEPAAYGIDRHNAAAAHNKALLDNGARPSGALVLKPVKVGENEYKSPPDGLVQKAREWLTEKLTGPDNAGQSMVFTGDVDWLEMGITPKDMDFAVGKQDAARDVCYAFGVPHALIVPGESTYNNLQEAKLQLYEETVLPLVSHVFEMLSMWLADKFGQPDLRLVPDLDGVSALEPRRESKRETVVKMLEANVIDLDEAREALQYDKRGADALSASVDSAVLAALVSAAQADDLMFEPLWRYMRSVGLVDRSLAFPDWLTGAMDTAALAARDTEDGAI